jgi:Fe-S cluster biosynthesis and repair protein YggX
VAERIVQCAKLKQDLPGLPAPPFAGALGQRIYENVSEQAWKLWQAESVIIMNHYGLSLVDPEARRFLMRAMEMFLFAEDAP